MIKKTGKWITGMLVAGMALTGRVHAEVVFNFDSPETGQALKGWVKEAAVTEVVSLPEGGGCLKVSEPGPAYKASLYRMAPLKGIVTVEFKIKADSNQKAAAIQLAGTGTGNAIANLTFMKNGAIAFNHGEMLLGSIISYKPDIWYAVRMVIDLNQKVYSAYVNDKLVADACGFINSAASNLATINVAVKDGAALYLDDVGLCFIWG